MPDPNPLAPPPPPRALTVAVVGPCAAGKSTLVAGLRERGYNAHHVAQEHSFVPEMWQEMTHPDVLVYLNASYETIRGRRQLDWTEADYAEQQRRLGHARQNASLYLSTDNIGPEEMVAWVLDFLGSGYEAGVPSRAP